MDTELITNELIHLKTVCQSANNLSDMINQTGLLIFSENGYSILSYELASYLEEKYSQEFPLDELHSLLPSIVANLDMHLEPVKKVKDLSFLCYNIFLI